MNDPREEKLEQLLRARRIEPASPELTQRIVLAARDLPQTGNPSFWGWIRDLFREFYLPQPSYVLGGALLVGMVIGFNTPSQTSYAADEPVGIQSYLSADEALL